MIIIFQKHQLIFWYPGCSTDPDCVMQTNVYLNQETQVGMVSRYKSNKIKFIVRPKLDIKKQNVYFSVEVPFLFVLVDSCFWHSISFKRSLLRSKIKITAFKE